MGHSGGHPWYIKLVLYNPNGDIVLAAVTPFIEYIRLPEHLVLLIEAGKGARSIAGYTGT